MSIFLTFCCCNIANCTTDKGSHLISSYLIFKTGRVWFLKCYVSIKSGNSILMWINIVISLFMNSTSLLEFQAPGVVLLLCLLTLTLPWLTVTATITMVLPVPVYGAGVRHVISLGPHYPVVFLEQWVEHPDHTFPALLDHLNIQSCATPPPSICLPCLSCRCPIRCCPWCWI